MRQTNPKLLAIIALLAASGSALAGGRLVEFNEVFINAPGTDQGFEFIELKGVDGGLNLDGYTIVIIEGDPTGAGIIDQALSLNGKATGSNGLFVWRDSSIVTSPPVDPQTSLFVQDFTPDIENGGNTYLIVQGFTGSVGQDLDTNNDGTLDVTPWTFVVDAIGFWSNDDVAGSRVYAPQLGGLNISDPAPQLQGFTPDTFVRICGTVFALDVLGANPGPWVADPNETLSFPTAGIALPSNYGVTPGSANPGTCGPVCDSIDFNNDTLSPDSGDLDDFIAVFSGGPSACSTFPTPGCNDLDFNNDGLFPDAADLDAFIIRLAGGPCTLP
jgi:hypothetical protein